MGRKFIGLMSIAIIVGAIFIFLNTQQVSVATLSGQVSVSPTYTTSDFSASQVSFAHALSLKVTSTSRLSYMLMPHGKPAITQSTISEISYVVNLTITFKLLTPTGKQIEFEPLKLGKGGIHNFTLIIGPDEGIETSGTFTLIVTFRLKVTTPAGVSVIDSTKTIQVSFTVPQGTVSIQE